MNKLLSKFGLISIEHLHAERKKYEADVAKLNKTLEEEQKVKRHLYRELGNYLIDISSVTGDKLQETVGRNLRHNDNASIEEIMEGKEMFYHWLESQLEEKQQTDRSGVENG